QFLDHKHSVPSPTRRSSDLNDGGAGLHLLGQIVLTDLPNTNIYTVSNNIIANNYSDLNGAGIWAQHCKVNIVNNTIVNNLSQERDRKSTRLNSSHVKISYAV